MFSVNKALHYLKSAIFALSVFTICFIIIYMSKASSDGARYGLSFCSDILIPSLFPFMIMASFIIKSGLSVTLGKLLEKTTNFLFNLPGCCAPTILIGLIGGYPTGAKGIASLYEEGLINNNQAEQMLYFVVSAGPAFTISVVGMKLLNSPLSGIIIFFSQTISAILIGIAVGIINRKSYFLKNSNLHKTYNNKTRISYAIVESCKEATYGIINMCSFVILFSVICNLINTSGLNNMISNMFTLIGINRQISHNIINLALEITGGCISASKSGVPLELIAFALAWAGLCVHFQIFSSVSNIKFSTSKFLLFRLIHGIIAAFISHLGFYFFPPVSQTSSIYSPQITPNLASDIPTSILLTLLCFCFLLILEKNTIDLKLNKW